jgi:hypothetical protein
MITCFSASIETRITRLIEIMEKITHYTRTEGRLISFFIFLYVDLSQHVLCLTKLEGSLGNAFVSI